MNSKQGNASVLIFIIASIAAVGIGAYIALTTAFFKAEQGEKTTKTIPAPQEQTNTTSTSSTQQITATSSLATKTENIETKSTTTNLISKPPPQNIISSKPAPSPASTILNPPEITNPTSTLPAITAYIPPAIPSIPSATIPIAPVSTSTLSSSSIPKTEIDPGVIVGIACEVEESYTSTDTNFAPVSIYGYSRGSGVIIDKRGYILTNRHVGGTYTRIATTTQGLDLITYTITLKNGACWVGQYPKGVTLPAPEEIKVFNPTARIPVLAYTAEPLYEPNDSVWSESEKEKLDFTVLKITGLSADGPTFGVTSLPSSFPYAKILPSRNLFKKGKDVLSYGAPGDATTGRNDDFFTIYILGAVGKLESFENGDKAFLNIPAVIYLNMDIAGGRSGSPVFADNYVIGVLQSHKSENRIEARAVASDSILKYLEETHGWKPEN